MSVNLTSNPIVITTAMPSSYKAATLAAFGAFQTVRIQKVYWENPINIGDAMQIVDPTSSMVILPLRCEVAGQSQVVDWTPQPRLVSDFIVNQISSGTLYIYLK
jgi:hypothetical protein